jgi:hypothetical protein
LSYKGNKKGNYGYNQRRGGQSGFHSYGKSKNRNDNESFENQSQEPENQAENQETEE